jgi:hypothetical protein
MARQNRSISGGEAMNVNVGSIIPNPSDEEAAAIAAAVTMMWPQPVLAQQNTTKANESWRFSGRWWSDNSIARRIRPGS